MTSLDINLNSGNKRFSFSSQAYTEPGKFSVVTLDGHEAISRNFHFDLILVSNDSEIDFEKMLSNPAQLSIFSAGGDNETPYLGVLSEFEQLHQVDQLHQADQLVFYRAVLAPRLARTALYRISDVHMGQKIPDIIKQVLKDGKTMSTDYETKLDTVNYAYRDRDFVCQYQETDLDFLSRWMDKEGLYYYFDHTGQAEKLVILNDTSMAPAATSSVTYRPVENMASGAAIDSVQSFVCRQKPLPKEVILQGFNYLKANTALSETVEISSTGSGQVMLYGENFLDAKEGKQYAKLRAEEISCRGKTFHGEATAVGLRSGYFVKMVGHYRQEFDGDYLVTEVVHQGSQAGVLLAGLDNTYGGKPGETDYHLSFRAIPKDVQFRPARSMVRPHVAGTVSAIVDAEGSGQYAEMDELGRYKVQLPFSKTGKAADKGSARIRMATPYSGSNHGMHFPLHKGAEVLLSFVDGDPDQPVILNAVPNSENPSMVNSGNPAQSLITTAGGNQILMDDTKGKEVVYISSPYQNSALVIGNPEGRKSTVGRDGKDGAAGEKGDTGAAAATPAPKEYPGIFAATGGSSESITMGTTNAIKLGFNNTIGVSVDNSVTASIANKLSAGSGAAMSYGADMSWKIGRSITLDDSESISLKHIARLQGNQSVEISGGQEKLLEAAVAIVKKSIKKTMALTIGLNLAGAVSAGAALGLAKKDESGKVRFNDGSAALWSARALGLASGAGTAIAVNYMLAEWAASLAELTKPTAAYTSHMKLNGAGIEMTATPFLNASQGRIFVKPDRVSISAGLPSPPAPPGVPSVPVTGLGAVMEVTRDRVNLTTNIFEQASSLTLTSLSAKLAAMNPLAEVSMKQTVGGSVTLAATGLKAISGVSKLLLGVASGAVLQGGPMAKVSVTSASIEASVAPGFGLLVSATEASLLVPGHVGVSVTPVSVLITGTLVQLG